MNKRFFCLITIFVTCLFSGYFSEVDADCTIDYYISYSTKENPFNDLTLTGDNPEFPIINWTRPDADEIRVIDDDTSELLYHLTGAIPRSIQYGDYSQPGTAKGPYPDYDVAPPLELDHLYVFEIRDTGGGGSDIYGVVITGVTCDEEGEFIISNTSECENSASNLSVAQDIEECGDCELNGVPLALGESRLIEQLNRLKMSKNTRVTVNVDCFRGLAHFLDIMILNLTKGGPYQESVDLAFGILNEDPSICLNANLQRSALDSGNYIGLDMHSGVSRFESALDDLVLDIATDSAKVSSVGKNVFAVDHNPDTTLTIAACFEGSVNVDPTNPTLSSITLRKGQQVNVWSDRISPITNIGQVNTAPILLLLDDGAK